MFNTLPRMLGCALITVALLCAALLFQQLAPASLVAVTLYKAHLMSLAGWGGYWLDRALFPYDRPHQYADTELLDPGTLDPSPPPPPNPDAMAEGFQVLPSQSVFGFTMLRRAVIVLGCLVCVGLGA